VILGSGADRITAADNVQNTMTGGAGADAFIFLTRTSSGATAATRDVILDFARGSDIIDISVIDADTRVAGTQDFIFDGFVAAGAVAAGHIGYHYEGTGANEVTVLEANVRTLAAGDVTIDMQIALAGHLTLTAALAGGAAADVIL